MTNFQEVYRARDPEHSGLIVAMLQQAGIDARPDGTSLGSAVGEIPIGWSTAPRIMVPAEEYDRARQIVMDWDAEHLKKSNEVKSTSEPAVWTCPECGEDVDYNFEMCWNCQYNRTAC